VEIVLAGVVLLCLGLAVAAVFFWLKFSTIRNLNSTRAAVDRATVGASDEGVQTRLRTLEQRLKAVEMEWENTYAQLKRTLGRVLKEKGVDGEKVATVPNDEAAAPLTRADVLRRSRGQ